LEFCARKTLVEGHGMIVRYDITLGARTTAGGEVISADPSCKIQGVPVAYEDDQVSCPACQSIGVIKPDGPRLSDIFDGKQLALSDDLCICKCTPPPRLIANQTHSCQHIAEDWHAGQTRAAGEAALRGNAVAPHAAAPAGIPLLLRDPHTDKPYSYRAYRLTLKDGVIEGTTDGNGATRPLTAQERAAFVRWHVAPDSAPA
jgi:uncharacterized Zn-binding protein involved in type VI secretion